MEPMRRILLIDFGARLARFGRPAAPAAAGRRANYASVSSTNPVVGLTTSAIAQLPSDSKILPGNTVWGMFGGSSSEPVVLFVDMNELSVLQGATIAAEAGVVVETVLKARTVRERPLQNGQSDSAERYRRSFGNYVVLSNGTLFRVDLYASNKPSAPGFSKFILTRLDHLSLMNAGVASGKRLTNCNNDYASPEPTSECRRISAFAASTASLGKPPGAGGASGEGAIGGIYIAVSAPVLGAPPPSNSTIRSNATLLHLYPDINAANDSSSKYAITPETVTESEFYFAAGSSLRVPGTSSFVVWAFARNFLGIWTANPEDWTKFTSKPANRFTTPDAIYMLNATDFSVLTKWQLRAFPTRAAAVDFASLTTVYGTVLDAGVRQVAGVETHVFYLLYSGLAVAMGLRPGLPEPIEIARCTHSLTTFTSGPTPPYPTKRITGATFDDVTSPRFIYMFSNEGRLVKLAIWPFPTLYEVSYIEPYPTNDYRDPVVMEYTGTGANIPQAGERFIVVPINMNPAKIVRFPTMCPVGTYVNQFALGGSDASGCVNIPAGFAYDYSNYPRNTPLSPKEFTRCPAGFYTTLTKTNSCIACPLGQRSKAAAPNPYLEPTFCPAALCNTTGEGYITGPPPVYDGCEACKGGSYANTSTDTCSLCPAGTFSGDSASACTPCPAGTFSKAAGGNGAVSCLACSGGGEISGPGATACTLCPDGQVATNDAVACQACPAGQYRSARNSTNGALSYACEQCPANSYSPGGVNACLPCGTGAVSPPSSSSCTVCAAGSYAEYAQAGGVCKLCPAGFFAAEPTANCTACAPGTFAPAAGSISCSPCPPGQFSFVGRSACSPCPPGTASSAPGQGACSACKPTDVCSLGTLVPLDATATGSLVSLVARAADAGSFRANATLFAPVLLDAVALLRNGSGGAGGARAVYRAIPTTDEDAQRAQRTFLVVSLVEALGLAFVTLVASAYLFCTKRTALLARLDLLFKESHSPIDIHGTGIEYSVKRRTPGGGIFTVLAVIGICLIFSYTIILFVQNNYTIASGLNPGQEQAAGPWTLKVAAIGYGGPCDAGVDVAVAPRQFLSSTRPTAKGYQEGSVDTSTLWAPVSSAQVTTTAGSSLSQSLPVCVASWSCPFCMLNAMTNTGIKVSFSNPASSIAAFAYTLEVPGGAYSGSQAAPAGSAYRRGALSASFGLLPVLISKDDKTVKGFNVSLSAVDEAVALVDADSFNDAARAARPTDFSVSLTVQEVFLQVTYIPQTNTIGLVSNLLALYSGVVGFLAWVMNKHEDLSEFREERRGRKVADGGHAVDAEAAGPGAGPAKAPSLSGPPEMFRIAKDPEKIGVRVKGVEVVQGAGATPQGPPPGAGGAGVGPATPAPPRLRTLLSA
eukprot:tig00021687_g23110.t1